MHPREFSKYLETDAGLKSLRGVFRGNFCAFVDAFFWWHERKVFRWNRHHFDIVNTLMAIHKGEVTYQIINIPPRYSKTELVVKLFSAWAFAKNPECKFLHLSYSDQLVCDNSDSIKDTMQLSEYALLFPGAVVSSDSAAKAHWSTVSGGEFLARPAGGSVTGFGAGTMDEFVTEEDVKKYPWMNLGDYKFSGAVLIDDPLKPDDGYSDTIRKSVNRRWDSTIKSRRNNPDTTPVICIMQRLHEDDFAAKLMASKEYAFAVLCMPALTYTESGKSVALWPEKHGIAALQAMQDEDTYTFSSQMQQAPTPLGGGIFKKMWLRYWDHLPQRFEKVVATADTAGETKTHSDYSVFQLWGRFEGKAYLIDQIRGKWESPEMVAIATITLDRWKTEYPYMTGCYIEKAAIAIGFIQTLKRQVSVPIFPVVRHRDKVSRAFSAAPYIQSGMVMFPPKHIGFAADFEKEVLSFTATDSHAHDDQVDPMMDAVEIFFISPEVAGTTTLGGTY